MKIIAVVGDHATPYKELSAPIGKWLATLDVHLLTGGGPGVMEAVSKAFVDAPPKGLCIGVLPTPKKGYPNPHVQLAIRTHLHGKQHADGSGGNDPMGMYSRNRINALTADVVIALPGGDGTLAEMALAKREGKPVIAFLKASDSIDDKSIDELRRTYQVVDSFSDLQRLVNSYL